MNNIEVSLLIRLAVYQTNGWAYKKLETARNIDLILINKAGHIVNNHVP